MLSPTNPAGNSMKHTESAGFPFHVQEGGRSRTKGARMLLAASESRLRGAAKQPVSTARAFIPITPLEAGAEGSGWEP